MCDQYPNSPWVLIGGDPYPLLDDRRFSVTSHFPPGTKLYDTLYTPPREVPMSPHSEEQGVTACKLQPCGSYGVSNPAQTQALVVHNLPEHTTAEQLGKWCESLAEQCYIQEADVFRWPGEKKRCKTRGYVLFQNPQHTQALAHKQLQFDRNNVVFFEPMDWRGSAPNDHVNLSHRQHHGNHGHHHHQGQGHGHPPHGFPHHHPLPSHLGMHPPPHNGPPDTFYDPMHGAAPGQPHFAGSNFDGPAATGGFEGALSNEAMFTGDAFSNNSPAMLGLGARPPKRSHTNGGAAFPNTPVSQPANGHFFIVHLFDIAAARNGTFRTRQGNAREFDAAMQQGPVTLLFVVPESETVFGHGSFHGFTPADDAKALVECRVTWESRDAAVNHDEAERVSSVHFASLQDGTPIKPELGQALCEYIAMKAANGGVSPSLPAASLGRGRGGGAPRGRM